MKIKDLINDNTAFHCDTKEKAVEFLHKAHALGYMWRYIDEDSNCYNTYGCDTCYKLSANGKIISFSELNYFKKSNHTIIEYELDKLTPLEYLMEYLGVEEDEEFNIIDKCGKKFGAFPYTFVGYALYDYNSEICNELILELMNGSLSVEKLPWKPKNKDTVWYVSIKGKAVCSTIFSDEVVADLAKLKNGWYFKTKAEAEANKERILKEYTEVISYD